MYRIRFHGRGGQGMKTASRILGAAAFHAGYVVQDSPIYGAERRGAPMAAFVRMGHEPIYERGLLQQPDLVIVADDTLLGDPAAQPLSGCDTASVVLINSRKNAVMLRQQYPAVPERLLTADFTALAFAHTQTLSSLSTALGVAAARLVGLKWPHVEAGLTQELADQLPSDQWGRNVALAQATSTMTEAWHPLEGRETSALHTSASIAEVTFDPPRVAAPSIAAQANSPERKTGTWRQVRPVLHQERCTRCWICFVRCPEAAISLDAQDYPVVNYDECKGCLLCVHECPTHAFSAEKEVR
jgi:pyruvate ferredoxin oxidoreductase gamma subunit